MRASGYVLTGGASSRMGRDKAFLPYRGSTLVEHVARAVREAAGSVALIGPPVKYASLGYPVYPDKQPGYGPLGGVYTALAITPSPWNLVVACDMPGLSTAVLNELLARAVQSGRLCVMASATDGSVEPLCAVYHQSCLPVLEHALRDKRLKMNDLAAELAALAVPVETAAVANVNSPVDWARFEESSQ